VRPPTLHARGVDAGRAAARQGLQRALAIFDAWYDERRIRTCPVCLGVFVRPVGARQGRRIYCSAACGALIARARRPARRRRPAPSPTPLLDASEVA
jgi:hypothetical protein